MRKDGFYELLHGRGLNTTKLAKAIGSSRGHVTEVLNGKPGHGAQTRKKLARMLTWEELQKLGWTEGGEVRGQKSELSPNVRMKIDSSPCPLLDRGGEGMPQERADDERGQKAEVGGQGKTILDLEKKL